MLTIRISTKYTLHTCIHCTHIFMHINIYIYIYTKYTHSKPVSFIKETHNLSVWLMSVGSRRSSHTRIIRASMLALRTKHKIKKRTRAFHNLEFRVEKETN